MWVPCACVRRVCFHCRVCELYVSRVTLVVGFRIVIQISYRVHVSRKNRSGQNGILRAVNRAAAWRAAFLPQLNLNRFLEHNPCCAEFGLVRDPFRWGAPHATDEGTPLLLFVRGAPAVGSQRAARWRAAARAPPPPPPHAPTDRGPRASMSTCRPRLDRRVDRRRKVRQIAPANLADAVKWSSSSVSLARGCERSAAANTWPAVTTSGSS